MSEADHLAATAPEREASPWLIPLMRRGRPDATMLLWLALTAVLVFLVVVPLVCLLITSFSDPDGKGLTLANYATAFGTPRYLVALGHSVVLGASVAVLTTIFGVPIAWAVSRTDVPAKGFVRLMTLGAFVTPPYVGAIGWMLLAGPNAGWLNRIWMALTGSHTGPFNIYSFPGLAFVIAIYSYPYAFVFVNAALDLVSSEIEDAAHIVGAGTLRTTFGITLPLVLPAIVGAAIISFLEAIALFGTPALIALPARFNVVTIQLWEFFEYPVQVQVAAAFAIPLLGITIALLLLQRKGLSRKGFVSLTGKGGERRMLKLGCWRWVMFGYCLLIGALSVLLPFGLLLQASFAKAWGNGLSIANFTLKNFEYVLFGNSSVQHAIANTFIYAVVTAFLAIVLALCAAYIASRRLIPFARSLSFLCMAPFVVPGIILAVGFYAAFASPPVNLYGTSALIILAFTTRFLPIAYACSAAGLQSINPEMEDAVRILGGGRLTAIRYVVAPLLKKSLAGGWILVFIPATRELSTAMFLTGPHTQVISVVLFDLSSEGNFEILSALSDVLLIATIIVVAIGLRTIGRDFMLRRSN